MLTEGTLDLDVVEGRQLEGLDLDDADGMDVNWKGWIGTLLMEGASIGRVGRDVDWIRTLLLEGTLDPDVVDGRVGSDVGSGRCCWKGIGRDVNWKGCIRTLLLNGDWKGWIWTSLLDGDWKGRCC